MEGAQPQAAQYPASTARLVAACLLGFVAVNALVWLWVKSAALEEQPVDVQTRLVYRLRLDSFFARAARERAVFVGDSLVHGAHLREREGKGWAGRTLSSQFARGEMHALNLGVDGMLFSELSCVVHDVLVRKPHTLVIVISPRPLAAEFAGASPGASNDAGPDAGAGPVASFESARAFLCPSQGGSLLEGFGGLLVDAAYRGVPVYRYRDLLQLHYLDNTPRGFLLAKLTPRLQVQDDDAEDEDLAVVMLRMRAAQRLASVEMDPQHPQARALAQLLAALKQQTQTRVLIVYFRENLSVLAGALDAQRYEDVAQRFSTWVSDQLAGAQRTRFLVESAAPYAGEFVDHIHLTSRGYERLASRIHAELPP